MARPDRGNKNPEGAPVQVTISPTLSCAECFAQVLIHDMPMHLLWHEGVETKIKKAEKTLKREPRMSSLSQEMNP